MNTSAISVFDIDRKLMSTGSCEVARVFLPLINLLERFILASKKDTHMYDRIRKIMHCISTCFVGEKGEPVRLRVEGATTTLTPEPDDAELAAEALLQSMGGGKNEKMKKSKNEKKNSQPIKDKAYYEQLAKRMQEGHEMEARITMRFVAYCEQELKNPLLPIGRIVGLEHDLLQRQAIADREGGELKTRWQHCLAEITVRNLAEIGELSVE